MSLGGREQGVSYGPRGSPGRLCVSLSVCVPMGETECGWSVSATGAGRQPQGLV